MEHPPSEYKIREPLLRRPATTLSPFPTPHIMPGPRIPLRIPKSRYFSTSTRLQALSASALPKAEQISAEWKGTSATGANTKNFIGGQFVESKSTEWIDVHDPVSHQNYLLGLSYVSAVHPNCLDAGSANNHGRIRPSRGRCIQCFQDLESDECLDPSKVCLGVRFHVHTIFPIQFTNGTNAGYF